MKPIFLLSMLSLLSLVLGGCDPRPVVEKIDPPRPVRSVVAGPANAASLLTLPGEVRPRIETRYGFRIGGKISQRTVSIGDRVVAGQVLARLDSTDVMPAIEVGQAQSNALRTEVDLAAVELRRLKELRAQNYISQAQLDRQQAATDSAHARLSAAEAQLKQARNTLSFQVLTAGAAGVVTSVEAEAGQVVSSGQTVVRIAQAAEQEILVNIPEADLQAARDARDWKVVLPALVDRPLQARMRELSPVADPASRTYPARLALTGDTRGVELGMSATVQAIRAIGPGIVLPLTSLHSKDGQPRVWVVDPQSSTVNAVAIRTGGFEDEGVRVVAGVNPGDRVVTAGANLLVAGQKVRLLDAPVGASLPSAASPHTSAPSVSAPSVSAPSTSASSTSVLSVSAPSVPAPSRLRPTTASNPPTTAATVNR